MKREALQQAIDQSIRKTMAEHNLPGVAVVVVQRGRTIVKCGYGLANVERKIGVDPDKTLFRIGSISKALTLLTVTRLAEQERLTLDDDVAMYFRPIQNPQSFKKPITVRNLLTHTTGLDQIGTGRQIRSFDLPLARRKALRPSITEFLLANNLRRVTPAGEHYRYDTYGSTLAGAVLEKVTGKPYPEAMRNEMFKPLGMSRTFVEADEKHITDLATGYEPANRRNVAQPYEIYLTTPASSIDSTPADMGRLLEALTSDGANSSGRFLNAKTVRAVMAPQYRPHPEFCGTTHGLHESYDASGKFEQPVYSVEHGGTMLGFRSLMAILPEHKAGVFIVTNRSGGGRTPLMPSVMRTVVAHLSNVATRKPYPVPKPDKTVNLKQYEGRYRYGVFCHSCTAGEFAQGAWRPGSPRTVRGEEGTLRVGDARFFPRGKDVFVREDGKQMVFFGRNDAGKVTFFTYSTSDDAFERMN